MLCSVDTPERPTFFLKGNEGGVDLEHGGEGRSRRSGVETSVRMYYVIEE